MADFRERETKYDVAPDWVLPGLAELVPDGGRVDTSAHNMTSTYFDTASRDLLSAGAMLQRRSADTDTRWQLKIQDSEARTEVRAEFDGRGVPSELRELIVGVRGGESLRTMVTIRSARIAHVIRAANGNVRAEVDDDRVSAVVHGLRRRTVSWREIKLTAGDEEVLRRAGRELIASGATPTTATSRVARALYRPRRDAEPDTTLNGLIRSYVTVQVDTLLRRDIDLRRDRDVVHDTRVAIRRLRSVLHAFGDLFDPGRATTLNTDLSWYAGLLGEVRDREVLRLHLREALAELPPEAVIGPVSERIEGLLGSEQDAAKVLVTKAMKSQRYLAMVRELKAWRDDPAFLDGREPRGGVSDRSRAATAKMHARSRAAERLSGDSTAQDEALHRARKAAKRARYVAELALPRQGNKARARIVEATTMQDRLGGHHDNVIAAQFLLRAQAAADAAPGESPFSYGVLWAREQQTAREAARTVPRPVR